MKNKKIAVFGMIESKSRKRWEISSHIEDGVVDVLVNEGYTIVLGSPCFCPGQGWGYACQ